MRLPTASRRTWPGRRPCGRRSGRSSAASSGQERGQAVKHAQAFEICEYGVQPDESAIRRLFPFFPLK